MPSISASSYAALRTCPRLFYWEQVRYMQRVREDGARAFGTLYHKGLEAWWSHAGAGSAPWSNVDDALARALASLHDAAKHADTDPYERAAATAMLVGYHTRWKDLAFERIGVGVEDWFKAPLVDPDGKHVNGWYIIGRKDAFVQFYDKSRASVVEHKHTKQDITFGGRYWERVEVDTQSSMYIDSARAAGIDAVEVLYDVSRRPDVSPEMATPEDKREYTKGKGCKTCGGTLSGDIKPGSGFVLKSAVTKGKGAKATTKIELAPCAKDAPGAEPCPDCTKTPGMTDLPRLYAKHRDTDETPEEYGKRVATEIMRMPDAYYKQASVQRNEDAIAEARADLVAASVEIDTYWSRARATGDVASVEARRCFARNTNTCMNVYGRRCDWLDVCNGRVNPMESQLYQIKPRRTQ